MFELVFNGVVIGVFSTEDAADRFMEIRHPNSTYSIYPIGTFLVTDINGEL